MFETLKNAFKVKEIRTKILITLALVLVYRIGCFIPVPGIDSKVLSENLAGNTYFSVMSAITGGSLSQGTLFAMGIVAVLIQCSGFPIRLHTTEECF